MLLVLFFLQQDGSSGEITIAPPNGTASVYIDRDSVSPITSTSSPAVYDVSPGSRQILVARDGYWPWTQQVDVIEGESAEIAPFLIEETSQRVLQAESDVTNALSEARTQPVPSSDSPAVSENGDVRIFVDNETNIIAQWTGSTTTAPGFFDCHEATCGVSVINQAPVQQLEFYPQRDDVIFFSTQVGVYAIEINPRNSTQNFQPVVEGVQNPVFTTTDSSIFVLSGDRITVNGI